MTIPVVPAAGRASNAAPEVVQTRSKWKPREHAGLSIEVTKGEAGYRGDAVVSHDIVRHERMRNSKLRRRALIGLSFFPRFAVGVAMILLIVHHAMEGHAEALGWGIVCLMVLAAATQGVGPWWARRTEVPIPERRVRVDGETIAHERGGAYTTLAKTGRVRALERVISGPERYRVEAELDDGSRVVVLDELTQVESEAAEAALRHHLRRRA